MEAAAPAAASAVKRAGIKLPTEASTAFSPGVVPSVQVPEVARPFMSVVAMVAAIEPPPAVSGYKSIGWFHGLRKIKVTDSGRSVWWVVREL
jgi:hypothetical protein